MKLLLQLCVLVLLLGSVTPSVAALSLVDHYRKAIDADPQNADLRYHLGVALLNRGENRGALEAFRQVYPERAKDPELNFNLALVYSRLRDPDSALLYLDQAQSFGADQFPEIYPLQNVYFNLVLLYEEQGQLDDGVRLLKRMIPQAPEQDLYLRLLGDFELRRGNVDAAIANFEAYLERVPADHELRDYAYATFFNRGMAALEQKEPATARVEFAHALRFEAAGQQVGYYLALLDYQEEKYAQAAERLSPVYAQVEDSLKESARAILYNSALNLKKAGKFEDALRALTPICSVERPRSRDLSLMAGILLGMKKYPAAREAYLQVLQLEPANGAAADGVQAAEKGAFIAILDAVGAAFAVNDLPAARTNLVKAAEIFPEDNRLRIYQMRLARLSKEDWLKQLRQAERLEEEKKYSEALSVLRSGLKVAPEEEQLLKAEARLVRLLKGRIADLFRQAQAAYAAGELQKSRKLFGQLLDLSPAHQEAQAALQKIDRRQQEFAQRQTGFGEASLAQGDLLAARNAFAEALGAWPELAAAQAGRQKTERLISAQISEILMQARRARNEGRLVEAREMLKASLQDWPVASLQNELRLIEVRLADHQSSLVQLVGAALDKKLFRQAEQLLLQADRSNPGAAEIGVLRKRLTEMRNQAVQTQLAQARKAVAAGNFDAGLKGYRKVLDLVPSNQEALAGLRHGRAELETTLTQYLAEGDAAHRAGKLELAREAYRKVLNLDPHRSEALAALRKIERAGRAGLTLEDSRRLYLQGIELYTGGDYRQAIAVWRQVLDLDPAHEKAQMNIDKAERKLKQIAERKSG